MAAYTAGSVDLTVVPDMRRFGPKLRAELRRFSNVELKVKVKAELDPAALTQIQNRLNSRRFTIRVAAELDRASLRRIQAQLNGLRGRARIDVDIDNAALARLEARLRGLRGRARVDVDSGNLGQAADHTSRMARFMLIFKLAVLGVTAILPLLPALLSSALGIVGVLALAFKGVGDAIQGYTADQENAAKKTAQSSAAASQNAREIRDANRTIDDARRNAARVARDSGEQVQAALKNQAQVERETAQAVEEARDNQKRVAEDGQRSLTQASRRVADAIKAEKAAHEDIARVLKDQKYLYEDLSEQVSDYALDSREAALQLIEAEKDYRLVMSSGGATLEQREQAEINLARARDRVSDISRESGRVQAELAEIERTGIENTDAMVDAKGRHADAVQAVRDAQEDEKLTIADVAQANEDAAMRVAQAVISAGEQREAAALAVAQAQRQRDEANADAQRQVSVAVQGLSDVLAQQAEQQKLAAVGASEYATAMAKLTPPAQELVRQLLAMKPLVDGLQATAAAAFLPGLTQMLKDSAVLFPIFNGFLKQAGEIMGQTARDFGNLFKSDDFQKNMQATLEAGLPLIKMFGDALLQLTDAWNRMGAASGPAVQGFVDGFMGIINGITGMMEIITPYMGIIGDFWRVLGELIGALLPPLAQLAVAFMALITPLGEALLPILPVIVDLFSALMPLVITLADILGVVLKAALDALMPVFVMILEAVRPLVPVFQDMAVKIGDYIVTAIEALAPLLPPLISAFFRLIDALLPILPILIDFNAQIIEALIPFLPQLTAIFIKLIDEAIIPLLPPLLRIIELILPDFIRLINWLAPLVIWLAEQFTDELAYGVENVLIPALTWLADNWTSLGDIFDWVYANVILPVFRFFERTIDDFGRGWDSFTQGLKDKWQSFADFAKRPVNFIIDTVWNQGIGGLWDAAGKVFPLGPFARAPMLAEGGPLHGPGTGTSDSIPALLSNGEHVWTAAEVANAGGHGNVMALRQMAAKGMLPRFAGGGPVSWQEMWAIISRQFPGARRSSDYRPGDPGFHGQGKAVDIAGPHPGDARFMAGVNQWIAQNFPGSRELIYTPGINLNRGHPHTYSPRVRADHYDHVHWANVGGEGGSASGVGGGFMSFFTDQLKGIFDRLANPLVDTVKKAWPGQAMTERLPVLGVEKFVNGAREFLFGKATELDSASSMNIGGGVAGWRPVVLQALQMMGQPATLADTVLRRMNQESGGNARAINNWDSNAKRGTPSKGLMQVIDPTFRANYDPRTPNDIWNPLSNIVASMKYALRRYGSLSAAYNKSGGYDSGGWLPPGATLAMNGTGVPEAILTGRQWDNVSILAAKAATGGEGTTIHVHPREQQSEEAVAFSVQRRLDFQARLNA